MDNKARVKAAIHAACLKAAVGMKGDWRKVSWFGKTKKNSKSAEVAAA